MGLFSYDNDGSTITIAEAGGGATPTNFSFAVTNDVTYTESAGVLSGTNGVLDGVKVNQFAKFTHIKDDNSNQRIEIKANTSGEHRAYNVTDWMAIAPYVYWDIKGDFDLIVECDSKTGETYNKAVVVAAGSIASHDNTYSHMTAMEYGNKDGSGGYYRGMVGRPGSTPYTYINWATTAYDTPRFIRITREGDIVRWRYGDTISTTTEYFQAGGTEMDVAGAECRLCIGLSTTGSPCTDTVYIYDISGSYLAAE